MFWEIYIYIYIYFFLFIYFFLQRSYQRLAEEKRLHLVEFREENLNFPKVMASPKLAPVRTIAEIDPNENLNVAIVSYFVCYLFIYCIIYCKLMTLHSIKGEPELTDPPE